MAGGSELGSAHVSIFPQMRGFRQNVAKETSKSVSNMKNAFSKGFDAGKQGKTLGGAFKKGFGDGSRELNSEALQSFKKDVAQASQKNTDALLKYKAASVQVQAAQERLNAATQKYGADSTQAQAAAIKLEQAQIRQKAAADNLKAATDNLKTAKGRLKDLETQLAAEADKSKTAFNRMSSGFTSASQQIVGKIPGVNSAVQKISSTAGEVTSNIKSKFSAAWNALPEGARNAAVKAGNALHSGLSKASGLASQAVSGIGNAAKGMATVVSGAATAAAGYLVNFGKQSVAAALKAGEVTAKFQQIAKNNNWTDEEQKSLLSLNKTLGQTGVISGGTLKAAQAQLGTFALTADQVKTLTPALADMIANNKGYNATAQDGVQIANLLGKVMTGSATALSKYGVTMTDAQKKVLQEGSASEKAAMAAQVLEANFGGINKALAQTPQGKMTILQHEIAGLKTSVGNDLIAAFGGVGGAIIKMVQAVEPLITVLFDKIAQLAQKIGPPLEKVFGAIADKIGKIDFNGFAGQLSGLSGPYRRRDRLAWRGWARRRFERLEWSAGDWRPAVEVRWSADRSWRSHHVGDRRSGRPYRHESATARPVRRRAEGGARLAEGRFHPVEADHRRFDQEFRPIGVGSHADSHAGPVRADSVACACHHDAGAVACSGNQDDHGRRGETHAVAHAAHPADHACHIQCGRCRRSRVNAHHACFAGYFGCRVRRC